MSTVHDWNKNIVEEFRANDGHVGGPFEGVPILLLHHTGAKSGTVRVNPLAYQAVGDGFAIFGSKGGAPDNPDWVYNLKANPEAEIEVGTDRVKVRARILEGDERERVWTKQKIDHPGFAGYDERVKGIREIPVVLLEPI